MTVDRTGSLAPGGHDRIAELRDAAGVHVHHVDACDVDSSSMTPAQWGHVSAVIRRATAARPGVPVLVTHGTDTLAWTAGALSVAGGWDVPVVLTGSFVPLGFPDSDAPSAIEGSLAALGDLDAGVHVVVASEDGPAEVFQGGFVRKGGSLPGGFWAPGGRLGVVVDGSYIAERPWRDVLTSDGGEFARPVLHLAAHPAFDEPPVLPDVSTVVVCELYASLTAPPTLTRFARRCVDAGLDVLACGPAPVEAAHGYVAAEAVVASGAVVYPAATVELLVPYAAALRRPASRLG